MIPWYFSRQAKRKKAVHLHTLTRIKDIHAKLHAFFEHEVVCIILSCNTLRKYKHLD